MINKLPKIVIFDWDSTLAQTRTACVDSVEAILKKYNQPEWKEVKKKRDNTKSFKENFINYFPENHSKAYKEYVEYYINNNIEKVIPTKDAREYLNFLVKNNVDIHIVSNKDSKLLNLEVKQCFKDIKFTNIIGSEEIQITKPAPNGINLIKNKYHNINNELIWMVGDSTQDSQSAINADVKPIIITNHEVIKDHYNKNPKELTKISFFNGFSELHSFNKKLS